MSSSIRMNSKEKKNELLLQMQQSRLDKFFTIKKSATISKLDNNRNNGSNDSATSSNQQTNKRLSTTDNENNKKLKRAKSDTFAINTEESSQSSETNFSLNQFYLNTFLKILSSVIEYHKCLFDENELLLFVKFQTLPASTQIIFVRLLMRRCKWLRRSTINYEITNVNNENDSLTSLVETGLLQDISSLDDLDAGLRLLSSEEMRDFSKRFHCQSKTNKSKKMSIENLKSLTCQYKSMFGSTQANNRDHILLKELKRMINNCYKISEEIRGLFFRMMLVYHPVALTAMDDLDQNAFTLLYKTFLITRGQLRLPWNEEQINHEYLPFKTPEQLKRYQEAMDLEIEYTQLEESKKQEELIQFYETYNEEFRAMIDSSAETEHLPGYFRRFSPVYVRARILSSLTEVLQRARRYDDSIELLQYLLNRPTYNRHRRGKLWNRLALIQENYVKTNGHQQCLNTIYDALKDPNVKLGDRLSLCERARKLFSRPKSKGILVADWIINDEEDLLWTVPMPKEIEVTGRLLANDARMGKVTYKIQNPIDGSIEFCNVEQLAIHHYQTEEDYSHGIHSEGSIIRTLVGLLFLDLIYTVPTPDLLIDIFQTEPLDFQSDAFYKSRQNQIDERINNFNSEESIQDIADKNWDLYYLTMSSVVDWELFATKSTLLDALKCLTPEQIQLISTYTFVHNRAVWKGFPDLFVWNPTSKKCKVVEVKSHNDRLSYHQIVWLDKLVEFKIDCEVCKVSANGSKKILKRTSSAIELD